MDRKYTTQMDAARKGILTREMEIVAKKERMEPDALRRLMAEGKAVICANRNHESLAPEGVGSMLVVTLGVFYAFSGTELIGVAAGETKEPAGHWPGKSVCGQNCGTGIMQKN